MSASRSVYQPQFALIQAIALGLQTLVTFTAPCDFSPGEVISFRVSPPSGTKELNNQQTTVLSVSSDNLQIVVGIDSRNYTPFVFEPENQLVFPAMCVPVGSGIIPNSNPSTINLADVFDNVPLP